MEIVALDFTQLDPVKKQAYLLMSTPRFRSILSGKNPYDLSFGSLIAFGAEDSGMPQGLCLAAVYPELLYGEIYTLHVTPSQDFENVGQALFQATEKACFTQGANHLVFLYLKNTSTAASLEKVLENSAWKPPHLFILGYFLDCWTFDPPWFNTPPSLPQEFKEFKWIHLKPTERDELLHKYRQGQFTSRVSPFQEVHTMEPLNSIGLRHKKEVIAWMICHRMAPDTIRYTALYAQPEFLKKGLPIRLLVDAIDLQRNSPVRWSLFEVRARDGDKSWLQFVQKRLAPYAVDTAHIYRSWKALA